MMNFGGRSGVFILAILGLLFLKATSATSLKCVSDDTTSLKRGNSVVICVHIPELSQKMAFSVEVDKYSAVNLSGGFKAIKTYLSANSFPTAGFNIVTQAPTNSVYTESIPYVTKITSGSTPVYKTFPLYSAVVTIDSGKITGIVWDNGCWSGSGTDVCQSSQITTTSVDKNNFITTCIPSASTTDTSCDPKIFISWIGTDSSGNYMTSGGLRMSRFQSYAIGELYSSSKALFSTSTS